jgi:nucleotide-binding universal stress UspA family protein
MLSPVTAYESMEGSMACKDILVHFDNSPAGIRRVEAAARLAERHSAHLTALVLERRPLIPVCMDAPVPQDVVDDIENAAAAETARTVARLEILLARQIVTAEHRVARYGLDSIADTLAQHARYADLLVLGQPDPGGTSPVDRLVLEQVLLSSGRPVLVIPAAGAGQTIGERVLVAWDAGREAVRAVADAMPLIEAAGSATILTVNPAFSGRHGDIPGADIARHLARHGVAIETTSVYSESSDPTEPTLGWMREHGTDLLVMGAYGHTRVRELMLGGMTRGILKRMTVPVLMSH